MPKSTKLLLFAATLLTVVTLFIFYRGNEKNTLSSEETQFAVADSGLVKKIEFLHIKTGKKLKIELQSGRWIVNDSLWADNERTDLLQSFIYKAQLKRPVYKEQINDFMALFKSDAIRISYYDENRKEIKSLLSIADNDETVALLEGYSLPYLIQIQGFEGNLNKLLTVDENVWKNRTVFASRLSTIEALEVNFNENTANGYRIVKNNNGFSINGMPECDSLRLYSYLQLYENVTIKEWISGSLPQVRDSLLKMSPQFIISLTDKNSSRSNNIKIYYKEGQKTPILGLVGINNDACIIKTSIFEYLLQQRSFFIKK